MKTMLSLFLAVVAPAAAQTSDDILKQLPEDVRKQLPADILELIEAQRPTGPRQQIDPDKEIYGVRFGASEEEFIKAHGKPTGNVRLSESESALLYGTSHAFLFEGGKLVGVRITRSLLDWKLTQGMGLKGKFNEHSWQLTNGIRHEMSRSEVRRILGDKLLNDSPYQFYYRTDKARVDLDFSHYTQQGDGDEAHRIHGILVRQGGREYSPFRTVTFPGKRFDSLSEPLPEGMGRIGVKLGPGDGEGLLEIVEVLKDGAADKAGVRPGSLIVSVDGAPTEGKSSSEVQRLIRGKPGSQVTLGLWNLQADKTNKVTLTREGPAKAVPAE